MKKYWLVLLDKKNGYFYNADYKTDSNKAVEAAKEFTTKYPDLLVLDIGHGNRPQAVEQLEFMEAPQIYS